MFRWLQGLRDDKVSQHVNWGMTLDLTIVEGSLPEIVGSLAVVGIERVVILYDAN